MNDKRLIHEAANLQLSFSGDFHQDWDAINLCPLEVMRAIILGCNENGPRGIVGSMEYIYQKNLTEEEMTLLLSAIGIGRCGSYYKTSYEYFEDLLDFIKYVAYTEKGVDLGSYTRNRGKPLLDSLDEVDWGNLPEGVTLTAQMIQACFREDCLASEYGIGYGQQVSNYFSDLSEEERFAIDKELRALYRSERSEEELRDLIIRRLGSLYNLDYYGITAKMFLAAIIEILYYELPMDKREVFYR